MDLYKEIKKFRKWADKTNPAYDRYGQWEYDYDHWYTIYDAFDAVLAAILAQDHFTFSDQQIDDILYILARDYEVEIIKTKLAKIPTLALFFAKKAVSSLHSDAKWQLAKVIGSYTEPEIDELIFQLSLDRSYYAQRICMMESAKRKSPYTRQMIDWSWETYEEYQRISALWSLHWIQDPDLKFFLEKAKKSDMEYLVYHAEKIEKELGAV